MKRCLFSLFLIMFAVVIFSCKDEPNNTTNNNDDKEVVPPEDTVYAQSGITIVQGGDTVYYVSLTWLPYSFSRFSQIQPYTGATPHGGAAMFLMALNIYQQYKKEGIKALVSAVSEEVKVTSTATESYNGYTLYSGDLALIKSQLANYPKLTTAYVRGATPDNGYLPQGPPYYYDFTYDKNNTDFVNGVVRVFVLTKGADSPRPITMVRDSDSIWRAKSFSSVLAGLK